jgi:GTP cyclohydrolase II
MNWSCPTRSHVTVVVEEDMIIRLAEGALPTRFGTFQEVLYDDGQHESIALLMGEVAEGQEVLCRVHSSCLAAHAFNSVECDCREPMALAQAVIAQEGRGLIIWLDQEGRGHGHLALICSRALQADGLSPTEVYRKLFSLSLRERAG